MAQKLKKAEPTLLDKWLKSLRSGTYTQGRHNLYFKDDDGEPRYCCLGVLCEVAGLTRSESPPGFICSQLHDVFNSYPPYKVVKQIHPDLPLNTLTVMNDIVDDGGEDPYSFEDIADYIEQWIKENPNGR